MTNADLTSIAERKGITLAQLLIAWGIKRGYVVLPKSGNPARIRSNFSLADLSEEDFEAVNNVAKGRHYRFVNPLGMFGYNCWPEEGPI